MPLQLPDPELSVGDSPTVQNSVLLLPLPPERDPTESGCSSEGVTGSSSTVGKTFEDDEGIGDTRVRSLSILY